MDYQTLFSSHTIRGSEYGLIYIYISSYESYSCSLTEGVFFSFSTIILRFGESVVPVVVVAVAVVVVVVVVVVVGVAQILSDIEMSTLPLTMVMVMTFKI